MKLKQFIYLLIVFIAVLGFAGFLKSKQPTTASTNNQTNQSTSKAITSESYFHDFGSIPINGGKVEKVFKIKNTSDSAVTLSKMLTSCMCTEAYLGINGQTFGPFGMPGHGGPSANLNTSLGPSDEGVIKVVFDPAAHGPAGIGTIERIIILETSDGKLELKIKANVTP